ncbi:MAG TPA: MarR family winged helix-turn-helix transcriptional regulator [Anaerovoracaceae bacterium]|nr:MarR family winged helix-turn-helix transcriptional regulator [Anaerovoracaceae bacterium]
MDNNIIAEIIKISHLLRRQVGCGNMNEDFHNRLGITGVRIVKYLMVNKDKDIFQKDIEEYFSLRASSVSVTLKKLENKGFIYKEAVKYDARLKRIKLTNKAFNMHEEKIKQYETMEKNIEESMTHEEVEELNRLLSKLSKTLDSEVRIEDI